MRDSDWSRRILLRSDWLVPRIALMTTIAKIAKLKSREILKRKFPSVDKPLKKGFEKYNLRG